MQAAMRGMKAKRRRARWRREAPDGVSGNVAAACRPSKSPRLKRRNSVGDQSAPRAFVVLSMELVTAGKTDRVAMNVTATASRY